jgi:hypothetical protein
MTKMAAKTIRGHLSHGAIFPHRVTWNATGGYRHESEITLAPCARLCLRHLPAPPRQVTVLSAGAVKTAFTAAGQLGAKHAAHQ